MLRKWRCGLSGTAFIHMIWELDFFDHNLSVSNFLLKINLLQSSPKNNRVTLLFIIGEKSTFALLKIPIAIGGRYRGIAR